MRIIHLGYAKNQAARLGACQNISLGIESQRAYVGFLATVKKLSFSIRCGRKNLSRVAGSYVNSPILVDRQTPEGFFFWIEEYRRLSSGRYLINFAVGRRTYEKVSSGIDGERLRRQFSRFE